MKLYKANVADILRTTQRDDLFIMELEQQLHTFTKLLDSRNYSKLNTSVPMIANIWYYFMTSLAKIQTLGEEYTGTVRVNNRNQIPSNKLEIMWLVLHVGGEPMLDRLLHFSRKKVSSSLALQDVAKKFLLKCIQIIIDEKQTLKQIHNSLFYINGKYYNVSNRIAGIQYVLLREWLEDNTFSGSFYMLGNLSLFYVLLNFVFKVLSSGSSYVLLDNADSYTSKKSCILCGENITSACATPCGHTFCWNCIYESLQYQKKCPICREDVNPMRIIFLQNFV